MRLRPDLAAEASSRDKVSAPTAAESLVPRPAPRPAVRGGLTCAPSRDRDQEAR